MTILLDTTCSLLTRQSSSHRVAEGTVLAAGALSTSSFSSMVGQMDMTRPLLSASCIHCCIPEGREQLMPRALWYSSPLDAHLALLLTRSQPLRLLYTQHHR